MISGFICICSILPLVLFLKFGDLKTFRNFKVSTELKTNWNFCRNQALYISEFIYQQNPENFRQFLLRLHEIEKVENESEDQKHLINLVKKYKLLDDSLLSLLKLNLEMESFAPKFKNIIHLQSQNVDCDIFVEYKNGEFTCSLKDLKGTEGLGVTNFSAFDYDFSRLSGKKDIRIYTIPGAKNFKKFIQKLEKFDLNILIRFISEPKSCPFYTSRINLTGYGLEFELKANQEFEKVVEESDFSDDQIELKSLTKTEAIKILHYQSSIESFYNVASTAIDQKNDHEALEESDFDPRFSINYLELKEINMDPFRLLDFMNAYVKIEKQLETFENSVKLKQILKSREESLQNTPVRYKIDSEAITFLNNLETDKRYSEWPKSFDNFEVGKDGRYYSRNILTVIIPVHFDQSESADLIENLVQMVTSDYPMRLGVLPIVPLKNSNSSLWIRAYYAIRKKYGLKVSTSFLKDALNMHKITSKSPEKVTKAISELLKQLELEVDLVDGDEMIVEARKLCRRFAIDGSTNEIFMNGLSVPRNHDLSSQLMFQYFDDLEVIKDNRNIFESSDLYSAILKHFDAKEMRINMADLMYETSHVLTAESIHNLLKINNYAEVSTERKKLSIWLAGEFDKKETFIFFIETVKLMEKVDYARLRAFVTSPMTSMPNRIVLAATAVLAESSKAFDSIIKFLDNFYVNYFGEEQAQNITGGSDEYAEKLMKHTRNLDSKLMQELMSENEVFYEIFDELNYDDYLLLSLNGVSHSIDINDCEYYASSLVSIVDMFMTETGDRLSKLAGFDETLAIAYSIYENDFIHHVNDHFPQLISTVPLSWPEINFIEIGDEKQSIFHIQAIFDPFSRKGQKFAAILSYFSSVTAMFSFKLGFISEDDDNKGNIYRFVTPETKNIPIPVAKRDDQFYSMTLDLPGALMITSESSNCDLTKIQPRSISLVKASFTLKALLIEGQVIFEDGEFASGRIVQIYSVFSGLLVDESLVMANYGYYQVKADAGEFRFRVINRISETEIEEYEIISGESVILDSFGGLFNRIKLSKQTPQKLRNQKTLTRAADLNIFSFASGYADEAMLRVMILSVIKANKTKSSIKVWILQTDEQTVSGLDVLYKKYEFEYEFVSYKWPSWLHRETEKYRTVLGYKILFLDVILPQSLSQVIILNPDSLVRPNGDLSELLKSADKTEKTFSMVPFCLDKEEMKTYRFWEDGYWLKLLNGKEYHISSLIVVNLDDLRKKFIADILRSEYHALSRSNSRNSQNLQNLDQDLLNNMQELIPIHSLDEKWLWCEAWCSERSDVKIINFCTNPSNNESKIDQAKRLSSEFVQYFKEIENALNDKQEDDERMEL